jgi:hypothetical protein
LLKRRLELVEADGHRRQHLSRVIVEVLGDTPALLLLHSEQALE